MPSLVLCRCPRDSGPRPLSFEIIVGALAVAAIVLCRARCRPVGAEQWGARHQSGLHRLRYRQRRRRAFRGEPVGGSVGQTALNVTAGPTRWAARYLQPVSGCWSSCCSSPARRRGGDADARRRAGLRRLRSSLRSPRCSRSCASTGSPDRHDPHVRRHVRSCRSPPPSASGPCCRCCCNSTRRRSISQWSNGYTVPMAVVEERPVGTHLASDSPSSTCTGACSTPERRPARQACRSGRRRAAGRRAPPTRTDRLGATSTRCASTTTPTGCTRPVAAYTSAASDPARWTTLERTDQSTERRMCGRTRPMPPSERRRRRQRRRRHVADHERRAN